MPVNAGIQVLGIKFKDRLIPASAGMTETRIDFD
jgi:hypothetical protein